MAYRNTFFRWLFLYSLTFGLTYVLKLFTYLCPETGQASKKIKKWILLLQRINNKMKQALRINIIPNHSTKISVQQIKYAAPGRIPLGIAL